MFKSYSYFSLECWLLFIWPCNFVQLVLIKQPYHLKWYRKNVQSNKKSVYLIDQNISSEKLMAYQKYERYKEIGYMNDTLEVLQDSSLYRFPFTHFSLWPFFWGFLCLLHNKFSKLLIFYKNNRRPIRADTC